MNDKTILPSNLSRPLLIDSGLESNVYRVKSDDGKTFILKKRTSEGRQNYLFEAYILRELISRGCKVPEVIFVDHNQLLMSAFSGQELDDQENLYKDEKIFIEVAKNLAMCTTLTFSGFGEVVEKNNSFSGRYPTWLEYLNTVEGIFDSSTMSSCGLSSKEISQLKQYWLEVKTDIHLPTGALVHGDFAMSAIFVDKDEFEGIIDFGDALIGDPLMDIAYFRFKEITKDYGDSLYRKLLNAYEDAAGHTVNDAIERKIVFYMIYWGLRRISHCPDEALRQKFADKLRVVASITS